ncbi:GNAT family N-acetyltransferase [Candidatus Nucleicultrix amoebiphila]|uniref:N-acetyltransferase domain-containing protein n=1 Tax=Candidatus Nucleicultrix amoebiphila FS5 TaxID=1414854 RepID=A0A1W6N5W7_9PROT|nr:hypothetical protein [Candidatus Nucleicultrix amoebiphila]ARN85234.1 hypothetical protein GQ61_07980 [Candidatus Nucleicultrix amoebiphila FS5]
MSWNLSYIFFFLLCSCFSFNINHLNATTLEHLFQFETPRTNVRLLKTTDRQEAHAVEKSTTRFVKIFDFEKDSDPAYNFNLVIPKQEKIFGLTCEQIDSAENNFFLYLGAFLKRTDETPETLIGLLTISNIFAFPTHDRYLSLDLKFHSKFQGQGYGKEVLSALIKHLKTHKILPTDQQDLTAQCRGVLVLVNFQNKICLNFSLLKGDFKIVRLYGARIEMVSPIVQIESLEKLESFNTYDERFHEVAYPLMIDYLQKKPHDKKTRSSYVKAKKSLIRLSWDNLMRTPIVIAEDGEILSENYFRNESVFISNALSLYPELKKSIPEKIYPILQKIIETDRLELEKIRKDLFRDMNVDQKKRYTKFMKRLQRASFILKLRTKKE